MTRDDLPVAVEILDDDGNVIATEGEPTSITETPPHDRRRRPATPILIGAVFIVAAAVLAAFNILDTDEREPPVPDPLPIVAAAADLELVFASEATFPLFGQRWDFEVLMLDGAGREVLALDLNSGEMRTFGETGTAQRIVIDATVIDTSLYIVSSDEIIRIDEGAREGEVIASTEGSFASAPSQLGNYWFDQSIFTRSATLRHLATGTERELAGVTDFVVVGDDIFAAFGGRIMRIDTDGVWHEWASGEILAAGSTGVAWRACRGQLCDYWAGTAENPQALHLSAEAALDSLILGLVDLGGGRGPFGHLDLLSPSLRYATTLELEQIPAGVRLVLVDLQTGNRLGIEGLEVPPTFSPDERAIFARRFGQLIAVDTRTGDAVVLPAPVGSPSFLNSIPLLPSN